MPLNHSHAFGGGGVFQDPLDRLKKSFGAMRESPITGLKLLVTFFLSLGNQVKARVVWCRFRRYADIEPGCWFGLNAWCSAYGGSRSVQKNIEIRRGAVIRGVLRVEEGGHIVIGEGAYIGDDSLIDSSVSIVVGRFTMLAHGIHIFDNDSHPLRWQDRIAQSEAYRGGNLENPPKPASGPVRIGDHVWVGFNAFIGKGVTVGDRSVVAACSVVTRDVPPDCLVAGNPAKVIRRVDELGEQSFFM